MARADNSSGDAVGRALRSWTSQLIDTGGRNRLLYFKPLKRGTLEFGAESGADPRVVGALQRGHTIKLSACFPEDDGAEASQRARWILRKAREHEEEQGIRTLYLGWRLATWEQSGPGPATPNAPVLLAAAELVPQGRMGDDFALSVADDWEVNPSMAQLLKREFGAELDEAALQDLLQAELIDDAEIVKQLRRAYVEVPGFDIADGLVLGTFSYAKLPMVRDLEAAEEAVAQHPLVAAIAGDPLAQRQLRDSQQDAAQSDGAAGGDDLAPQDEFLVLDADGTQSEVINAAVGGANLVVVGPPGTGKSQTIANLLATLTARGRSTLFVAEKRAAIDAVVKRLQGVGLGDLVLDLHEGMRSRRQTAEQLANALQAAHTAHAPDVERLQRTLTRRRDTLNDAQLALHQPREPWGLSVYQLQSRILAMDEADDLGLRLRGEPLNGLFGESLEQAADELREYVNLGGPNLDAADDDAGESPWSTAHRASTVNSSQLAAEAARLLDDLSAALLPDLERELSSFTRSLKLKQPSTVAQARALLDTHEQLRQFAGQIRPAVFELDNLEELIAALEPSERGAIGRLSAQIGNAAYRAAKKRAAALVSPPGLPAASMRQQLIGFTEASDAWREASGAEPEAAVWEVKAAACAGALDRFMEALEQLCERVSLEDEAGDEDRDWSDHRAQLERLQSERRVLFLLPRLHELRERLTERGLDLIVRAARERGLGGQAATQLLEDVWTRSVLDAVEAAQPELAAFRATGHDAAVAEFCEADRRHIAQSPPRVVRAWAEAAVAARDAHPEQSQLIMREANRKRRHLPTRELFQQAPDVLTALKPCWVMSPLVVAQLLPLNGEPPFGVVVFDEASQIPPADAVSSLLRGRQAIVAGDPKQLPPTSFFTSSSEDEDEENDQDTPLTQDVESILDAMSTLLPMPWGSRTLGWHYRSKDERLIAFSNHHIYDRRLTTFPGALPDDCMAHVEVPFEPDAAWVSGSGSYSPEVERVIRLILAHAEQRSDETLGVIALGATHANRIAETLRLARRDRPDLDEFFSEANPEPFFVKNLERVQGDERDAIILTVGYGRTADGRMRYNFGPINQEGGFRRLNVAVTRAKRRMTVVSCFSADDMDPDRLNNQGVRMLRDYIEYAAGGGRTLGSGAVDAPPLNAFEIDIKKRLEKRGLNLQPQYGVSGYRIDFAVMHPNEPGRPILAIEADGAQYHSAQATRDRDRLRQENLERLGWRFHRIWSTEWFRNPEIEAERAVAAYRQALAADRGGQPLPAAEPAPPPAPPEPAPPPPKRGPRPNVRAGQKIDEYSEQQLARVVEWIKSDGRLRTEDELLAEAMRELGFKRRGTKIVAALQAAIRADS